MSTKPEALRLAAQLDDTEGARLHLLPYAADGCRTKWYIVDVVVREKILVEISDGEDEYDAKEIALDESRLFRQQTELEAQVDVEPVPAANECLEREMRCADRVIPRWDCDQGTGGQND